jgi:hypothetical protein
MLLSCSKEKEIIIPQIKIAVTGYESLDNISLPEGESIILKAIVDNTTNYSVFWSVDGKEVSTDNDYNYEAQGIGEHQIVLKVVNHDSGESQNSLNINVYGKYKHGTFILNEGNMTTEQGSLIFISPNGEVTDSLYWRVNGSFLGNTTQDIFILDSKMYIISQNGGGDGKLIIANAETLKKEIGYSDELSVLSWPSHIAVIENNAYIRDNKGVYQFNLSSKELKYIEGSNGASKNRMAVIDGKVFVPAGKNIYVIKDGAIIHTIAMSGTISGVIKTDDKNIYVSCTTSPAQINKINASDYSIIKTNEITEAKVGAGWGATPGISAKGDTIYFSNASTKIYRHIFSQNKTEYMTDVKEHIENAGIVYNNLAVHPKTGEVYFNTIKAYGWDFLINDISVFNFSGPNPVLKADYKNYTHFPAGIFFTDNF